MLKKNVSETELNVVKSWLKHEETACGHSFICNWNVIKKAYTKRRLWGYAHDRTIIGIIAWSQFEKVIYWDIAVVSLDHRGQGLGRKMVREAIQAFREHGMQRIELECIPPESESFWRTTGFQAASNAKSHWRAAIRLQLFL